MRHVTIIGMAVLAVVQFGESSLCDAVSPENTMRGRELFERNWQATVPSENGDGLGPLFNATSCAGCHHMGGIGGAGDARFNSQALAMEQMKIISSDPLAIAGPAALLRMREIEKSIAKDRLRRIENQKQALIRKIHPGFVPEHSVVNSFPLPHHSRNVQYAAFHAPIWGRIDALRSREGGPVDPEALHDLTKQHFLLQATDGQMSVNIDARLFYRNTPALFGDGLIDGIPEKVILQQANQQKRHKEISGRVSLLPDGSIGRFGWRARSNRLVAFVDLACANELGLETKRRDQMIDPTQPDYRNAGRDISDREIKDIADFVAALPRPQQQQPNDSRMRQSIMAGQRAFDAIGCAVCHVPTLGNVSGIYSDLLLHDMGPSLYDFDAAGPNVLRRKLVVQSQTPATSQQSAPASAASPSTSGSYGGSAATVSGPSSGGFVGPVIPMFFVSPRGTTNTRDSIAISDTASIKRTIEPSATSQEWRTPPLWGVAGSAPYLHDGRAATLLEAIITHDGEAAGVRDRFMMLPIKDRQAVIAFLESLVAPQGVPEPRT